MVLFNHATREMTAKIVYYGPGLCGKTTNLMVIFDKLDPKSKGKMLSLATKTDRTLFFDLLPVDIGKVGSFNLKIQLYTVPGQVFYNETRKLVLKGADAVVFVADSQPSMIESTKESFANLLENMEENQIDVNDTPIVIQYNKRDLPGVLPVEEMQEVLGFEGYPYTEASAIKGEGVMETFKLVSKITAKHLFNRLKGAKTEPLKARTRPRVPAVKREAPEPEPEPEREPFEQPDVAEEAATPFPESMPFPESNPLDAGYEKMEEVSLEQLLEERRERTPTYSGAVSIPVDVPPIEVSPIEAIPTEAIPTEAIDDVEELGAAEMLPIEETPAVAVMEEPIAAPAAVATRSDARVEALESEVAQLQQQIRTIREEHRMQLESLLRDLDELTERVRAELGDEG